MVCEECNGDGCIGYDDDEVCPCCDGLGWIDEEDE